MSSRSVEVFGVGRNVPSDFGDGYAGVTNGMRNKQRDPLPTLSRWAGGIELTPLQSALTAAARPDVLSFAMGLPDPHFFPASQLAEACARVLASNGSALQYSLPSASLKEKISKYMMHRGVDCSPDCVLLTQGAQQAVNLLARLLLDPGSSIIEEEVSYSGFQHLISAFQPTVLTVPTSGSEGINIDAVEELLHGGARPSFMYLMPTAHNPLGVTLPMNKRRRLAHVAREFQVPIVEDDPYGELFYDGESTPPLRAIEQDWVYYVGSLSKTLGPSLRIGWIVAPKEHIRALSVIKEGSDLDVSTLAQWVVNEYLETNDMISLTTSLRAAYRERRDVMGAALKSTMPACALWEVPASGLFFWIDLPDSIDAGELLTRCLKEERVAFLPGEACSRGKRKNGMRLNFSRREPGQIVDGIARIGRVLAKLNP
jgi:2-aminoadipate transaminase